MMLGQFIMEDYVRDLLTKLGLEQYVDTFIDNGFDDIDIVRQIDEDDLMVMGISSKEDRYDILDTIYILNKAAKPSFGYMEVEPEIEMPTGEDVLHLVMERLNEDKLVLSPIVHMFFKQDGYPSTGREYEGYPSTGREYDLLRARYAQELMLPNSTVADALNILHQKAAPLKPPKPKTVPVYDSKTGKLVWIKQYQAKNYENVEKLTLDQAHSKAANNDQAYAPEHNHRYEEILFLDRTQSANSSPVPIRPLQSKKKPFFKRVATTWFGKSSTSLDSCLDSSTKTLISETSSQKKLLKGSKSKNKSKDKKRMKGAGVQRQRSNSAPDPTSNITMEQIREAVGPPNYHPPPLPMTTKCKLSSYRPINQLQHPQYTSNRSYNHPRHAVLQPPVYAKPQKCQSRLPRKTSCDSGNQSWASSEHSPNNTCSKNSTPNHTSRNTTCCASSECRCDPKEIYAHVAWDDVPVCDTFSQMSMSSDSDSAYSSKSCLNGYHHRSPNNTSHLYGARSQRIEEREKILNTLLTSREYLRGGTSGHTVNFRT